jgi:hypothetical protein
MSSSRYDAEPWMSRTDVAAGCHTALDGYMQAQPGQQEPALLYESGYPPDDNHLVDLCAPQPALGRGAPWKTCRALATCWALIGAAGCAYLFLSSTLAVTTLGDPFL